MKTYQERKKAEYCEKIYQSIKTISGSKCILGLLDKDIKMVFHRFKTWGMKIIKKKKERDQKYMWDENYHGYD